MGHRQGHPRTSVAPARKLASPIQQPALTDAETTFVGIDITNRVVEMRVRLTDADGGSVHGQTLVLRDGRCIAAGPSGEVAVDAESGFEDIAAAVKTFVEAVEAHAQVLGLA